MATDYGFDPSLPPDVDAEAQALKRRQTIANMLFSQSMKPAQGQMVGRFYVPPSPLQGIAGIAQAYASRSMMDEGDKERAALGDKYRKGVADALTQYQQTKAGTPEQTIQFSTPRPDGTGDMTQTVPAVKGDPRKAVMDALASPYAPIQKIGALDYTAMTKAEQPFTLSKGAVRIGPDGKIIAENTAPSPGDIPMTVKEWEYYQKLPPANQRAFLEMKRATPYLDVGNGFVPRPQFLPTPGGAGPVAPTPSPSGGPVVTPSSAPQPTAPTTAAPVTTATPPAPGVIPKALPPDKTIPYVQGAADAKKTGTGIAERNLDKPQARMRVQSVFDTMDRLSKAAGELSAAPGLTNITGTINGRTPTISQSGQNAQALLDTIKSQTFINALQAMREASKTGGAVGNVSDREGDRLQNVLTALGQTQDTKTFQKRLAELAQQVELSKQRIAQAYKDTYGEAYVPAAPAAPAPGASGGWSIQKVP